MQLLSLCQYIHVTALPVEWTQMNTSIAGHNYLTCICCTTNKGALSCVRCQLFRRIFWWMLFRWHLNTFWSGLESFTSGPPAPASNGISRVETKYCRDSCYLSLSPGNGLSISALHFRTTAYTQHLLIILRKHLKKNRVLRGKEHGEVSESNIIASLKF